MTRRLMACLGKIAYTSKELAERDKRDQHWRKMKVYRCLSGDHWHLAHAKANRRFVRFL